MSPLPVCPWVSRCPRLIALGLGMLWLVGGMGVAVAAQPAGPSAELPAELTTAARDYRIEIYGAFRQNRAEYDLRRKQGEALLAEWQARGALPNEAAVLVRWFDDARRAATGQQPLPAAPNWNGITPEVVPLPPRSRIPANASQTPVLRALPQRRVRSVQQVQVTTLSADIIGPRESNNTFNVIAALPSTSSLSLVLALQDTHGAEQGGVSLLAKHETDAPLQISSNPLALPAAKLNPNALAGSETRPTADETAELNTAELRARLRGYDKAWRALQVDLYSEEELTLDRAATLLTILHDLQQARRDLLLYQAVAPAELREELRGLPALDELKKRLRQVVESARANNMAEHTLTPGERATLERAWLMLLERVKQ